MLFLTKGYLLFYHVTVGLRTTGDGDLERKYEPDIGILCMKKIHMYIKARSQIPVVFLIKMAEARTNQAL